MQYKSLTHHSWKELNWVTPEMACDGPEQPAARTESLPTSAGGRGAVFHPPQSVGQSRGFCTNLEATHYQQGSSHLPDFLILLSYEILASVTCPPDRISWNSLIWVNGELWYHESELFWVLRLTHRILRSDSYPPMAHYLIKDMTKSCEITAIPGRV